MANDYQYIPGFYFKVSFIDFDGVDIDARFREVSGIQMEMETEDVRGGGENWYVHHLPKRAKFPNLTLRRAMHALPSNIVEWVENAIYSFNFQLHDVIVSLLNEKSEPLKSWNFVGAYPVKINVSDFKANENSLVIETVELAYKYFQLVSLKDFEKNEGKGQEPDISNDNIKIAKKG